jgi:hypothetical protein
MSHWSQWAYIHDSQLGNLSNPSEILRHVVEQTWLSNREKLTLIKDQRISFFIWTLNTNLKNLSWTFLTTVTTNWTQTGTLRVFAMIKETRNWLKIWVSNLCSMASKIQFLPFPSPSLEILTSNFNQCLLHNPNHNPHSSTLSKSPKSHSNPARTHNSFSSHSVVASCHPPASRYKNNTDVDKCNKLFHMLLYVLSRAYKWQKLFLYFLRIWVPHFKQFSLFLFALFVSMFLLFFGCKENFGDVNIRLRPALVALKNAKNVSFLRLLLKLVDFRLNRTWGRMSRTWINLLSDRQRQRLKGKKDEKKVSDGVRFSEHEKTWKLKLKTCHGSDNSMWHFLQVLLFPYFPFCW